MYCIIPRSTDSWSQPVSHLSANHDVLDSLHYHDYNSTNQRSLNSRRVSLPNHTASILTISKFSSNVTQSWPPTAYPHLLDHGIQIHLHARSIIASMCISKHAITALKCVPMFTQSRRLCVSPIMLDHGLQVHLAVQWIRASVRISYSLDYGLPVISILAKSWTRSVSVSSLHHSVVDCRQPIFNAPLRHTWHLKGILMMEQFWLEEGRKRVQR